MRHIIFEGGRGIVKLFGKVWTLYMYWKCAKPLKCLVFCRLQLLPQNLSQSIFFSLKSNLLLSSSLFFFSLFLFNLIFVQLSNLFQHLIELRRKKVGFLEADAEKRNYGENWRRSFPFVWVSEMRQKHLSFCYFEARPVKGWGGVSILSLLYTTPNLNV